MPYPAWVHALDRMPQWKSIAIGTTAIFGIASVLTLYNRQFGSRVPDQGGIVPAQPHTTSKEWKRASQEYMRFQRMNPYYRFRKGEKLQDL